MQDSDSSFVWFVLLDSATGQPYKGTTADKVAVSSSADVADFRNAVHLRNPNKLASVDAADLLVYKNKATFDAGSTATHGENKDMKKEQSQSLHLKSSCSLSGLGETEEDALIVVVPSAHAAVQLPFSSIPERLKQLGVEFTSDDIKKIMNLGGDTMALLLMPTLTRDVAKKIIGDARSKVQSNTRNEIGLKYSFYLDGPLTAGQGQTKSSLYYAFSESGGVLVAKVYNGHKEDFDREVEASKAVDHGNLVKFIASFSIQNGTRHILIMPCFPLSVANLLTRHSARIPVATINVIARQCFDALCHLHAKGYCFADLKPSNIMLRNAEQGHVTLVDYGATVKLGDDIIEFSRAYCLDANIETATVYLDWVCLGVTLAQLGGVPIEHYRRTSDLVQDVGRSRDISDPLKRLIVACLDSSSSVSNIQAALDSQA